MTHRTISINPQFFNMSKKKKTKIIPSQVNINSSNIRQLLLDKLKEHKKTRKIETKITPLQDKTFDEQAGVDVCKNLEESNITQNPITTNLVAINSVPVNPVPVNSVPVNSVLHPAAVQSVPVNPVAIAKDDPSKPYGNLKNGIKPTFKQLYNQTETQPQSHSQIEQPYQNEDRKVMEEKEVKKIFKLGKKGRTISILIKNNKTRKLIEDSKIDRKKKNLSTIKNYLKDKNLIKFGTTAPSKLLREIYETSELCGGVLNENKDVLIHNFDK